MSDEQRSGPDPSQATDSRSAPDRRSRAVLSLEERIAAQEAIEDVRELFQRYTWALDHADFDAIVACFCEDGVFAFQDASWQGRDAIRDYFQQDRKSHTEMLHFPVNVVVDVTQLDVAFDGGGHAVASATLWDLFNRNRPGSATEGAILAGYYRLIARRSHGEWGIERLEVTAKWVVPASEWRMSADFQARPGSRG
jgi:uncharacterized protein (TIGR02246 family)